VGFAYRSFPCAAATFATGVFLDADHLIDYCYSRRTFTFSLRKVYEACEECTLSKLIFAFHSYELVAFLWIAIVIYAPGRLWVAVAVGLTQHLILDQITNPVNPMGYFFTYRLAHGFRSEHILRKKGEHRRGGGSR